jgi:hypothetical protein
MKQTIKELSKQIVPRLPRPLAYYCIDRYEARRTPAQEWEATRKKRLKLARELTSLHIGHTIMAGPFVGMKYVHFACGSALPPKLLGTYEMELRDAIRQLIRRPTDVIFNLGAAEGYYAVGMARLIPAVRVISFDWWIPAHYWLRRIAFENGVLGQMETRGNCTPAGLNDAMKTAQNPMVICDVEGAEDELLDPAIVPALACATILVELHDMDKPGITQRIEDRFTTTHEIQRWESRPRTTADLPDGVNRADPRLLEMMDEHRQAPQTWFLLLPRA